VDTNEASDIFLRDLWANTTTRISVDSAGIEASGNSGTASMTKDGKYVAFASAAANLSDYAQLGNVLDIFRHEVVKATLISGTLTLKGYSATALLTGVKFELVPVGGGTSISVPNVELMPGGKYSFFAKSVGTYAIFAKTPTSLRKKIANSVHLDGTDVILFDGTLILGDCNDDNEIGTDDYLILNAAFDTSQGNAGFDSRADLNGDGQVGTDDYLILNENFDQAGD